MKLKAEQFDKEKAEAYYLWLLKKYKNNYAIRCVEFVIHAIEWADEQSLITLKHIVKIHLKRTEPAKPTYFSPTQIAAWENFKSDDKNLFNAANLAVLQMHTGFDYGDFAEVSRDNFRIYRGRNFLIKPRQKNGNEAIIPLSQKAEAILEYYNYNMDLLGNPEYNLCLKQIAEKLGIKQSVKCKDLRKVFAMDQLNNKGTPIEAVSKMLGHKKIKTTEETYASVNINLISNVLDKQGL